MLKQSYSNPGETVQFVYEDLEDEFLEFLLENCHQYLTYLENRLEVTFLTRGSKLQIEGEAAKIELAKKVLHSLREKISQNMPMTIGEIDSSIHFSKGADSPETLTEGEAVQEANITLQIQTKKRIIKPRTHQQYNYIKMMQSSELAFATGPAGTGKTYLAVAVAVSELLAGVRDRIILSRPAIEAGEKIGFLPGDMKEKIDPYLRPLYDALYDMLPVQEIERRMAKGEIEVAPLAFMRGRTLKDAFIILDEAQNTTAVQMKMFLTRLGENSKMVVVGDLSQVDLERNQRSGLQDALSVLSSVKEIQHVTFSGEDVMRHHMVGKIVNAYDKYAKKD